jgi:hypothetical protein
VPVTERGQPRCAGHGGLFASYFCQPQIVESQTARNNRLPVPAEQWARRWDVHPFGDARPPLLIILGYRMELGQVEGDDPHHWLRIGTHSMSPESVSDRKVTPPLVMCAAPRTGG